MGKMSKNKGAGYELKIAKLLSPWWGGGFSRVPASGGLHWGSDQRVAGDIIAPQGLDFPFVIECKKREEWTMDHVLLNIGQPRDWWKQVVEDARRVKLVPLLIFSRNRAKDFVMLPYDEEMYGALFIESNEVMRTSISFNNIRDEEQVFDVLVTTYDAFSTLDIDYVRSYARRVDWDFYKDQYE
jgi:Holliday junction resolvase